MKTKSAHIKLLSLILSIVMVMSTALVFAEGEPISDEGSNPETTTEAVAEPAVSTEDSDVEEPVVEEPIPDPIVVISQSEAFVDIGYPVSLTAELQNAPEGLDIVWIWSSSDESIATVSADGVISGVTVGNATITAAVAGTEYSGTCEVTVREHEAVIPTKPTGVTAKTRYGAKDNGLTVKWTSDGANTEYYQILRGTTSNVSKMSVVSGFERVDASQTEAYWLEKKGTFYYAVKAVSADGNESISASSAKLTISGNILTQVSGLVWYGKIKKNGTKIYSSSSLKGTVVATLKKGTKVTAIDKSPDPVAKFKQPSKVKVRTSDGKEGWLKYSQLSGGVKAATDVKNDYTRSVKEDFVNSKGYSSSTKYLFWVSPHTQRAYLFTGSKGNWKLKSSYRVTSGRFSHATGAAKSTIFKKKNKVYKVDEKGKRYYFRYASYFVAGVSFHSGTWWDTGKTRNVLNKKGTPKTYGCLRMTTSSSKWIYNHIDLHTFVVVTIKA